MKNLEFEDQVFLSEPPSRVNKIHDHLYDYLSKEVPDMIEKRKIFLNSKEKRNKMAGLICKDSSTHIYLNSLENYLTMSENLLKNLIAHEYGHIIHLDKQKSANYEFEHLSLHALRTRLTICEAFAFWFGDEFTQYKNLGGFGTTLKDGTRIIPELMMETYQVFEMFSKKYGRKKVVEKILDMEKILLSL